MSLPIFSKDEAAFFLNSTSKDKYEIEYLAEEYLLLAEEQMFIKGEDSFLFTSDKIKDYFKAKLTVFVFLVVSSFPR